jgi:hypothetical protein
MSVPTAVPPAAADAACAMSSPAGVLPLPAVKCTSALPKCVCDTTGCWSLCTATPPSLTAGMGVAAVAAAAAAGSAVTVPAADATAAAACAAAAAAAIATVKQSPAAVQCTRLAVAAWPDPTAGLAPVDSACLLAPPAAAAVLGPAPAVSTAAAIWAGPLCPAPATEAVAAGAVALAGKQAAGGSASLDNNCRACSSDCNQSGCCWPCCCCWMSP